MQIVCGFDIHKDSVFVCIPNDNGDKFEAQYGVLTLVEIKKLHFGKFLLKLSGCTYSIDKSGM